MSAESNNDGSTVPTLPLNEHKHTLFNNEKMFRVSSRCQRTPSAGSFGEQEPFTYKSRAIANNFEKGPFISSVLRDAAFFRLGFTTHPRHAHFSSSFSASRRFLLLFAYFQCILGSRHAQCLLFATASRSKLFFDLSPPP